MTKTLLQDDFKGAPDWMLSAAVDENGHAFMNNYPKSDLLGRVTTQPTGKIQRLIGSESKEVIELMNYQKETQSI